MSTTSQCESIPHYGDVNIEYQYLPEHKYIIAWFKDGSLFTIDKDWRIDRGQGKVVWGDAAVNVLVTAFKPQQADGYIAFVQLAKRLAEQLDAEFPPGADVV